MRVRDYSDGRGFPKFIANIRKAATASLSDSDAPELVSVITGAPVTPKTTRRARQFVRKEGR